MIMVMVPLESVPTVQDGPVTNHGPGSHVVGVPGVVVGVPGVVVGVPVFGQDEDEIVVPAVKDEAEKVGLAVRDKMENIVGD